MSEIQVGQINSTDGSTAITTGAGGTVTLSAALTGTDATLSGGVYLGGTGAANYLDDYEEGTWTPAFANGTGVTHDVQVGTYTKIGNKVYLEFVIGTSALTGSVNAIEISGIPFSHDVTQNSVSSRGDFESIYLTYAITSNNRYGLSLSVGKISIREDASGTGNASLSYNDVSNATAFEIRGNLHYMTSA